MNYTSFKEQWVGSVASRTEEGLILPSPWLIGARREYRLSEAQTNEVIARVGYAGAIALLICLFGAIALVIVLSTEALVWHVAAAVFVVSVLGLLMLLGGLIYGIAYPVLAGLSWTKTPPKPRKEALEVLRKGFWTVGADFSTPWLIFVVLMSLVVLPRNVGAIYGSLVSGRISWEAAGSAALVLLTIVFCRVLLTRTKAWWAAK
jgi:hypothetical protein